MSIDLSTLPPPEFIEQVDFEALLSELRADLIARNPDYENALTLESDPLSKLTESSAYLEMLLRARINQVGLGSTLAFAQGGTLDHIGGLLNTARLVRIDPDTEEIIPERDDPFRARIQESFERLSGAGPRAGYEAHASAADVRIADVHASSPAPGEVVVTVLPARPLDMAPADMLEAVERAVNAEDVRPLTDHVSVVAAEPVSVDVNTTLHIPPGPDASIVTTQARAALDAYLADARKVGRTFSVSGLLAALHRPGVARVTLADPLGDIEISPTQAPVAGQIALDVEVTHA